MNFTPPVSGVLSPENAAKPPGKKGTSDLRRWIAAGLAGLDEFGLMVERQPQPVMLALLILYVAVCASGNQRPLWYDELTTNLPARTGLPGLGAGLRDGVQHGFLSPVLVKLSAGIFGASAWALRLPASLGYLAASAFLWVFLRRARLGNLFALFAVLILWSTPSFYYATEARPYGLILGFAAILLVAWQHAVSHEPRVWSLAAIAGAELSLMLCHPLAILAAMPVLIAEVARYRMRGEADWPLWCAAGYPTLGVLPMFLFHAVHPAFSPALTGRLSNGISFYLDILEAVAFPLVFAAFGALAIGVTRDVTPDTESDGGSVASQRPIEYALLAGGLLIPFAVNGVLAATQTNPYFPRYAIAGTLSVPMIAAFVLARRTGRSPRAGVIALVAAFACFLLGQSQRQQLAIWKAPPVASSPLVESKKDLPFVVASGLTFTEMEEREPAQFVSRVLYLRDPEAAVRYAGSGLFETSNFADYCQYIPHCGIVTPYADFTRTHRHFLVYGTVNYWEDWLLRRLMDEHAQLVWLGQVRGSYKDVDLFEVTLTRAGDAAERADAR